MTKKIIKEKSVKEEVAVVAPAEKRLQVIGEKILTSMPHLTEMYLTTDASAFGSRVDAINHSKTLTDDSIVCVKKSIK